MRENQGFLQHILDVSPSVISIYDVPRRKTVFVNRGIAAALGYAPAQVVSEAEFLRSMMHPDDWQPFLDHLGVLTNLTDEATAGFEFRIRHSCGVWRWFHSTDKVFSRSEDGSVHEIISTAVDITERKDAEDKARFMAALNEALLPIADPERIMATAVRMLGEHLGVDRCAYAEVDSGEDTFVVMGEYLSSATPRIDGRYLMSGFGEVEQRILKENHPYVVNDIEEDAPSGADLDLYRRGAIRSMVCVPLNKGGRFMARMAVTQSTPRRWPEGEIKLVTAVANRCWETVERARVTRSLTESDERYRAFIAHSSEAIFRFELEPPIPLALSENERFDMLYKVGYLAECNDLMAKMHGYDRADQIIGMRIGELLPREDPQNLAFLRAFKNGDFLLTDAETHGPDKEGNTRYFLNNLSGVLDGDTIVRAWGTCRDITAQKQAEEALRVSEERFSKAFQSSPHALVISRVADGFILEVNDYFLWMSGYSRDELIGNTTLALGLYADPTVRQRAVAILKEQHRVRDFEMALKRKTGEIRLFSFSAEPLDLRGDPCWLTLGRDITEQRQAEEARRKSEEEARRQLAYVEAIYATAPVGLCFVDTELRYRSINTRLAELNDKPVQEHIGRTIREVMPDVADVVEPIYRRVIETAEPVLNVELSFSRQSGIAHYMVSYYPIKDGGGRVVGVNVVVVEITQRKQAEEERERLLLQEKAAREEAETASRMKDEFLATISHELRTPLTSILGWARLLTKGQLSEPQTQHALEVITQNAQTQTRLVDDILDTSRIITGRLKLDAQLVDIERVFQAAVDVIRPSAEAKKVTLITAIDSNGDLIFGDANRLQQVIWNLLANALKFTNEGGTIEARLARDGGQIEVSVSDTGIGIDPQFLPFIFDRFRQADSTSTRRYGGLGLGLAIVRHVVEMHGGSVFASSPGLGRGSLFKVRFPAAVPVVPPQAERKKVELEAKPAMAPQLAEIRQKLDGVRVLVVEDDPDTLDMLKFILDKYGAEVVTAASTSEALKTLESWQPDALVSDLAMPDQDGYDLIGELRSRTPSRGGNIPAVALTAYTRNEDRSRALSAGFQRHVPKPVDPEELVAVVANLAGLTHSKA